MELNKNFDGKTKLCEWYKIMRQNLQKLEVSVNGKCDSDDVSAILADKIDSSAETISGIAALKEAYDSVDSAAQAINGLANGKLSVKALDGASIETLIQNNTNTMFELTNVTDAPGGDVQGLLIIGTKTVLWFSSKGDIYRKYDFGEWLCIESSVKVTELGNQYYMHSFGNVRFSTAFEVVAEVDLPIECKYLVCNNVCIPVYTGSGDSIDQGDCGKINTSWSVYLGWTLTGKHAALYGRFYGSGAHTEALDNIMFM